MNSCNECTGYGDDYYEDENGELVCFMFDVQDADTLQEDIELIIDRAPDMGETEGVGSWI